VGIDYPAPLFCGTGGVKISGTVRVAAGDQYTVLKVLFGPVGGSNPVVVSMNVPQDSAFHNWFTHVAVTQGTYYNITARLTDAAGNIGKFITDSVVAEACSSQALGLLNLLDDISGRLHNMIGQ